MCDGGRGREIGFMPSLAMSLGNIANIYRNMGRFEEAMLLPLQAELLLARGDLSGAEHLNQQGVSLGRREGEVRAALDNARLAARREDQETGVAARRQMLAAEAEIANRGGLAHALCELAGEEKVRLMALEDYTTLARRTPNAT